MSCFCGRIICTLELSLVEGMGWLMMHIARTTRPVLRTCSAQQGWDAGWVAGELVKGMG